jgi:hypothetical protein
MIDAENDEPGIKVVGHVRHLMLALDTRVTRELRFIESLPVT